MGFGQLLYPKRADQVISWLQKLLKKDVSREEDLMVVLKDGTLLCEAFNAIWPQSIEEIVYKKTSLAAMENVASFLEACELCGVPKDCLFESADLLQAKNPMKVLQTLFYISAIVKERDIKAIHIPDCDSAAIKRWKTNLQPEPTAQVPPSPTVATAQPTVPLPPPPTSLRETMLARSSQNNSSPPGGVANLEPTKTVTRSKLTKIKSSTVLLSPVVPMPKQDFPSPTSGARRISREAQPESVRLLLEKIDSLAQSQKILFQNSASYSAKLESLEFVNKSMFLKIDQMMDTIEESFKAMQTQIQTLEETNQRLEKRLEEMENTTPGMTFQKPATRGVHFRDLSGGSDDVGGSDDSSDVIPMPKRLLSDDLKKKVKVTESRASSDSFAEEISMPNPAAAKIRKRWFETEVAAGINVSALSKDEFSRQEAIYELIDSEEDYVNDLQVMLNIHVVRFRASNAVTEKDIATLFSNLEQISSVNKEFHRLLQERRKGTPLVEKFADIFMTMNEYFKIYTIYCSNHSAAGILLKKLLTTSLEFKALHDLIINSVPEAKQLTLESFLIKPIQRICKYPLLLREILKKTPEDHPDFKDTNDALEKIEAVITIVNNRTQHLDQSEKLLLLQSSIESDEPLELLQPTRKFLMEGTVEMYKKGEKKKERYLVLCNDLLLICKTGFSKGRYLLTKRLSAGMFLVNSTPGETANSKEIAFELIVVGQEKWNVVCANEEDKKKWVKNLEQVSMDTISKGNSLLRQQRQSGFFGDERRQSIAPIASLPSLANIPVVFDDDDDEKPVRQTKAMKLLGLEESDASSNNAKQRATTIKERRTERLGVAPQDAASQVSRDSSSVNNGLQHPETLENNIEELHVTTKEYTGKSDFELSFEKGVHLVITNKKSDEHWKAQAKGIVGYVPPQCLAKATFSPEETEKKIEACFTVGSKGVTQPAGMAKKVSREGYLAAGRTWRQASLPDGTTYFYCPETYETCYHLPKENSQQHFSWFEEPVLGRPGWSLIENNGLRYYLNDKTQETFWRLPS